MRAPNAATVGENFDRFLEGFVERRRHEAALYRPEDSPPVGQSEVADGQTAVRSDVARKV